MRRTAIDANQTELDDKVVIIKRVSKTVKSGRTTKFSALVVVGDGNGRIGTGLGKTDGTPEAIRKGREAAIRNLMGIPVDEDKSIPHDFIDKFENTAVLLKGAPENIDVIAGDPAHSVLEMVEIKDTRTKSLGPNNRTNVVLTTPVGLTSLRTPEEFAGLCGKSIEEIVGQQEKKDMAEKLKITLVKSSIDAVPKQETVVKALRPTKMHKTVEIPGNGAARGMVAAVWHLVKVEEI